MAVSGRDTVNNGTIEIRFRDGSDTKVVSIEEAAQAIIEAVNAL